VSQAYITLVVTALGTVTYGIFMMKNHKTIKAEELLTFAMWCGAIVTGIYMFAAAFRLGRQAGEETNGLYLGIFGVYLVLVSVQKVLEMLKRLLIKPSSIASGGRVDGKNPG
jgi:uncharacterized membrane protein HdeD (DUF308 family)